jgi:hypothetical protein
MHAFHRPKGAEVRKGRERTDLLLVLLVDGQIGGPLLDAAVGLPVPLGLLLAPELGLPEPLEILKKTAEKTR